MSDILRAVKGMNDILPASVPRKESEALPDSDLWQWFEEVVRSVLSRRLANENGIATPTMNRKNGKMRSVGVHPFHAACSRGG